MGSRHNRKRVRSRPRHRRPHQHFQDGEDMSLMLGDTPWNSPPTLLSSNRSWPGSPYSVANSIHGDRASMPTDNAAQSSHGYGHSPIDSISTRYELEMEKARLHMYGGEEGDDFTLCAPMLQVVMNLFGGNVDYEDD